MVYKYNFQERLNKFLNHDTIRFYKIIEMIQYTIIFYVVIILLIYLLNNIYYKHFNVNERIKKNDDNHNLTEKDKNTRNFYLIFFSILFDTILIIILFFYVRKFVLIFPSLPYLFDKKFIPHTTFDFVNKIALVYLTMSLLPGYNEKLLKLKDLIVSNKI